MARPKRENGDGSCRPIEGGKWECVVQSKYINPKTLKAKRFKRQGDTEREARKNAQMAMLAWEKEVTYSERDAKTDKKKTFGDYFTDYVEKEAIKTISDSTYLSYTRCFKRYFYSYPISNEQLQNLNKMVFQHYYDDLTAKYKHRTYALCIQFCRRVCDMLVEKSLIPENYAAQAKELKEVRDEYDERKAEEEKHYKDTLKL